jgi:hypothetical protein
LVVKKEENHLVRMVTVTVTVGRAALTLELLLLAELVDSCIVRGEREGAAGRTYSVHVDLRGRDRGGSGEREGGRDH